MATDGDVGPGARRPGAPVTKDRPATAQAVAASAYAELPPSGHVHLLSIPGIGASTAAVLVAKIIDIDRFAAPENLVGYFGTFPREESSGVDAEGRPLPVGTQHMSHQGNDLVAPIYGTPAFSAIQCNPAVRSLSPLALQRQTRRRCHGTLQVQASASGLRCLEDESPLQ